MEQLKPARVPFIGFDGEVVYADGMFQLPLTLGKGFSVCPGHVGYFDGRGPLGL